MRRYWFAFPIIMLAIIWLYAAEGMTETVSGCVACHTDAAKIQSLYIPPKVEFKVEAGEG